MPTETDHLESTPNTQATARLEWRLGYLHRLWQWGKFYRLEIGFTLLLWLLWQHIAQASSTEILAAQEAYQKGDFATAKIHLARFTQGQTPNQQVKNLWGEIALAEGRKAALANQWTVVQTHHERLRLASPQHRAVRELGRLLGLESRRLLLRGYLLEADAPEAAMPLYLKAETLMRPIKQEGELVRWWRFLQRRLRALHDPPPPKR